MNVTTFAPVERKRISFSSSSFGGVFKKIFSNIKVIGFIIMALLAAFGLYSIFIGNNNSANNSAPANVLPLKQSFSVVAQTKDDKTTNGNFKVDVTGAYRSDSVLVQGTSVVARNGKDFMVINMDITNQYNVPLYMYPVDSYRLIDTDGKKYAPTAHQGQVEVRPQSTKTSNVGFIVPKDQSKFKIEVGQLTGSKVILDFSLPI